MTGGASALYHGVVTHRRLRPRVHELRYRILSLLLDIDELDALDERLRLFSRRRFGVFSFCPRDVGDWSGDLRAFAQRRLHEAGIDFSAGAIRLLTMPRVLGMAFNPLTVWFIHDKPGALRAILYEVNNTFGERHHYLLPVDPARAGPIRQTCTKAFYVSPFMAMDLDYAFTVEPPGERLAVAIHVSDAGGMLLSAAHTATRAALTDAALARAVAAYPLLTAKVVGGIGWEAVRLWLKRIPLYRHPAKAGR